MEVIEVAELDDAGFRRALAVQQAADLAAYPDLPPTPPGEFARLTTDDRTEGNRHIRLAVVGDDGAIDVLAHLELEDDEANTHFCAAETFGAARHPGAGHAAVAAMVEIARADGRTSLLGWGPHTAEEQLFWTGLGATLRYTERESALDVTAVDPVLMQAWVDRRGERAADVELVHWVRRCPDQHLDAYVVSRNAMNDAPMGDIEINDFRYTGEAIREDEDAHASVGTTIVGLLAVDPDGGPVGHTAVHVNTHRPAASWQWDTVVLDHHRNRGVGRWLKAAMWQHLRADRPDVTMLRTGNAIDNDPMLAINVAMGFRPTREVAGWQADLDVYGAALDDGIRPAPRSTG